MENALEIAAIARSDASTAALDFDLLVRQHQRQIYRVLLGLLRDADTADDLTQECFVRAYKKRDSYRAEASVTTWLTSIAINLARDHARNRRVGFWRRLFAAPAEETEAALALAPATNASPERSLLAREKLAGLWEIVGSLPPRQREVFILRFVEEMPLDQIAIALHMRLGTVKAHLFRALGTVRHGMRELYGTTPER